MNFFGAFSQLFLTFCIINVNCVLSPTSYDLFPNACHTSHCKQMGLTMHASLNTSIDPCDDFYHYACGGWISRSKKPPSEIVWNHFHSIGNLINRRVQTVLTKAAAEDPKSALRKAQTFFRACLKSNNADERVYLRELRLLVDSLGGWPLANKSWNDTGFSWTEQVVDVTRFLGVHPIVKMHVDVDFKNTSRHILYIDTGTFALPRTILTNAETYASILLRYKYWILETARHIYPNQFRSQHSITEDIHQMVDFEIQLATLTMRTSGRIRSSMDVLSSATDVNWKSLLELLFSKTDVRMTDDDLVLYSLSYIENALVLIKQFKPKTIANYIMWTVIKSMSRDTSKRLRTLNFLMDNAILGVQKDVPRRQECVSKTIENLGVAVISQYAQFYLKPGVIQEVELMAENIKVEFIKILLNNIWLGEETKKLVVEKIWAIKFQVGYLEWMTNNSLVDLYYREESISNNYFVNVVNLKRLAKRRELNRLNKPVNEVRWPDNPLEVNAYYSVLQNSIIIPLGLLELPFFDIERPHVFNYGALGTLIGHEISHALDTTGRQADKNGNIESWWPWEDVTKYETIVQCFEKHYAKFGVDSFYTIGENIADNVGLSISYWASQNHLSYFTMPYMETYSRRQLFFISYAQLWCEISDLDNNILQEEHAPVYVRVTGTTNNSREFQASFECRNTAINNCDLW